MISRNKRHFFISVIAINVFYCIVIICMHGSKVSRVATVAIDGRWRYLLADLLSSYWVQSWFRNISPRHHKLLILQNFFEIQINFLWSQTTKWDQIGRDLQCYSTNARLHVVLILFIVIRQHCHKTAAVDTCLRGVLWCILVLADRNSKGTALSGTYSQD